MYFDDAHWHTKSRLNRAYSLREVLRVEQGRFQLSRRLDDAAGGRLSVNGRCMEDA